MRVTCHVSVQVRQRSHGLRSQTQLHSHGLCSHGLCSHVTHPVCACACAANPQPVLFPTHATRSSHDTQSANADGSAMVGNHYGARRSGGRVVYCAPCGRTVTQGVVSEMTSWSWTSSSSRAVQERERISVCVFSSGANQSQTTEVFTKMTRHQKF